MAGGVLVGQGRAGGHRGDAGPRLRGSPALPVPPQRFASAGLSHQAVGTGPGRCPRTRGAVPRAEGRTGRVPGSCSRPVPSDLGCKTSSGAVRGSRRVPPHGVGHLSVSALSSRRFPAGSTLIKAPRVTSDSKPVFIIYLSSPRSPPWALFPARGIAAVPSLAPGSPRHFPGQRLLEGIRSPG